MGILNLTPDSFYDGGRNLQAPLANAERLLEEGADILDIGAESTRPGAWAIAPDEELHRLASILPSLVNAHPDLVISLDTRNARTAAWGLEHGVSIINDVSGLRHDGAMLELLGHFNPGYVLVHSIGAPDNMQHRPEYDSVVNCVSRFFEDGLNRLIKAGVSEDRIVLDPGIGFGKTLSHNLCLLKGIRAFLELGRPLLVGLSMKSLFGDFLGLPVGERGTSTAVATALLWKKGVIWHRVHEVKIARDALLLAEAL